MIKKLPQGDAVQLTIKRKWCDKNKCFTQKRQKTKSKKRKKLTDTFYDAFVEAIQRKREFAMVLKWQKFYGKFWCVFIRGVAEVFAMFNQTGEKKEKNVWTVGGSCTERHERSAGKSWRIEVEIGNKKNCISLFENFCEECKCNVPFSTSFLTPKNLF